LLRHAGKYGGGENTYELIKNVPEIDLVIGAHTHKADAGSMVGRTWFVQPEPHGRSLMKVQICFDRKIRQIKQISSSMIMLEPHPEISENSPETVTAFYGKDLDHPARVIGRKTNADLVLYCVPDKQKLQKLLQMPNPGTADFYRVFAYFDPIITVEVSSGEFEALFREYIRFADKRSQYLAKSGFSANIKRGRLRSLTVHKAKKRYTLAISAYAAAGAGGNLPETRRILKDRINHLQAEKAPGILEVLLKQRR
jgi:hypothetical protein